MWSTLFRQSLELISADRCCACVDACEPNSYEGLCVRCLNELALPEGGVQGDQPLLWCALAPYRGQLQALLLRQRPTPDAALIAALAARLHGCCASDVAGALLVPVPS